MYDLGHENGQILFALLRRGGLVRNHFSEHLNAGEFDGGVCITGERLGGDWDKLFALLLVHGDKRAGLNHQLDSQIGAFHLFENWSQLVVKPLGVKSVGSSISIFLFHHWV